MSRVSVKPHQWQYAPASVLDAALPTDARVEGWGWTDCTTFPTEIHDELRSAKRIGDWNKGRIEHDIQWVSKLSWAFRSTLDVSQDALKLDSAELEFESLDTFAKVFLNGKEILVADNHFRTWRVAVPTASLRPTNELLIVFTPPQDVAAEVTKKHGPFVGGSCNLGDRSRIGIRKAQYHARWDWGPELWCMGVDRPVHLHLYSSRLKNVHTAARVDEALRTSLVVDVDAEGSAWRVSLSDLDGRVLRQETVNKKVEWDVEVDLWWPVNEGKQVLYKVQVDLLDMNGNTVDSHTRKIGFRRAELVQHALQGQEGTSFFFKINNRPIFIGGSNWIPIDMVLSTGTPERYRHWLELMVKGNQNMIRVWGGGVFEPSYFYELADELGLLVWQDFMFACAVYPIFPDFLTSVEAEVRDNVTRLRHHPSLVMLCGNNEDYQQILQWDMAQSGDPLPARKIYEGLLPEIVKELTDPVIPYWPGSPYGGKGWDTTDPTVGDIHQWDVWAGKERNYHDWDIMGGRFISEFGLPGLPNRRTVDFWLDGDESQAYPQSKLMQQHNKAGSHERRFAGIMNENFRMTGDLDEYIFRNQLMQSEGVGAAYVSWRREWRGESKEYCGGAIVWQLNDCWPVTSWAIVDYFYRPKPVFYSIARAMAPITVAIRREVEKNRENDRPRQYYEYGAFTSKQVTVQVWATNSGDQQEATFTLEAVDLQTGWTAPVLTKSLVLYGNSSTEIWNGECPQPNDAFDKYAPSGTVVLHARLQDANGRIVARYDDWPLPFKLLDFPDPGLKIVVKGDEIRLSSRKPAKGVWLDVEGDDAGVEWSDNSIDVFPGQEYLVLAKGLGGRQVTYSSLGWEKARRV